MKLFARAEPIDHPDKQEWLTQKSTPSIPRTRPTTIQALLTLVGTLPDEETKIDALRKFDHPALRTILRYFLDSDNIHFPVQATNYELCRLGEAPTLYQESRRLSLFCNDPLKPSPLTEQPAKRQKLFSDFLSSLLPAEVELVVNLVESRSLPSGLSRFVILKAFPNLLKPNQQDNNRVNARRIAEQALADAVAEQNRITRLCAETSIADEIIQAKKNLKTVADERVRAAEAKLSGLLGMRVV